MWWEGKIWLQKLNKNKREKKTFSSWSDGRHTFKVRYGGCSLWESGFEDGSEKGEVESDSMKSLTIWSSSSSAMLPIFLESS